MLAVGEWLWSSAPSGGPFVETQKDRAKTHIWVLPQLRRKMGHGFASSVGVCFVSQKHCVQPIFGFGSRYASAVGDSLSSVFPRYMNATSLFVVTLSLLGELGQESSADAIL